MYTHRISIGMLATALIVALSRPVSAQWPDPSYRAQGGTLMFGSTGNAGATLITIDPLTGAGTPVGLHGAFGPVSDIDCAPSGVIFGGTGGGSGNLITIDPVGPTEVLVGSNGLGPSANIGLEWVGSTLYATVIFAGGGGSPSDLVTLNPSTGLAQTVGPTGLGPIGGLAYDKISGIMYGVESGGQGQGRLVTIDLNSGAATIVGPTGFLDVAALEFDPATGVLFAGIGGSDAAAGSLIVIDPATGAGTLVGPTGFPVLSGITFCGEAPLGACCDPVSEICTDDVNSSDCLSGGGVWSVAKTCAQVACPPPLPEGCGGLNESFESGSFSGWVTQDLSNPFFPLRVDGAGVSPGFGFFASAPTDGAFAAMHGFDGDGPGTITVAEDVILPLGIGSLEFDYRAAWNLQDFGASIDRTFEVVIRPPGGGPPLQAPELVLTAFAGTIQLDTGNLTGSVDVSAFAGQPVRLSFEWFVPETFSGPAFFQLDNIGCPIVSFCGDGVVDVGEECDDAGASASCDEDCTFAECGDATVNPIAGEECDDGADNSDTQPDACRTDCTAASCGDGVADSGEACDPGADDPTDCCSPACQFEGFGSTCGSGAEVCSGPDTCDGNGGCNANHLPAGTPCGTPSDGNCFPGDSCSGSGLCMPGAIITSCIDDDLCCNSDAGCTFANDNDCPEGVPTVSTWGLVILALLLGVGAKIYFGRNGAVTSIG